LYEQDLLVERDFGEDPLDFLTPSLRDSIDQCPPTLGERHAQLAAVLGFDPPTNQAFSDQSVAHPCRCGRRDSDGRSETSEVLGTA
jgi:hypothetical protein